MQQIISHFQTIRTVLHIFWNALSMTRQENALPESNLRNTKSIYLKNNTKRLKNHPDRERRKQTLCQGFLLQGVILSVYNPIDNTNRYTIITWKEENNKVSPDFSRGARCPVDTSAKQKRRLSCLCCAIIWIFKISHLFHIIYWYYFSKMLKLRRTVVYFWRIDQMLIT